MTAKAINETEWLAELQRIQSRNDDGLTASEWADRLGCEHECALRYLKRAQQAGWLRVGKRRGLTIDGRGKISPVYQIVRPGRSREGKP